MSKVESGSRYQDAVLWAFAGYSANGEPKVSSPVDIVVRWEQGFSTSIGADGTPITFDGTVFVDQDVNVHGILLLGTTVANLPSPVTGDLMEVIRRDKIPDIKGRANQRTLDLKRWRKTLPRVV